jgi:hypothetical protein
MAGLVAEHCGFRRQGMAIAPGGEPLVVVDFGVQRLALAPQPVLPGEDPACPVLGARAERCDRPVRVQAACPGADQRVQSPV